MSDFHFLRPLFLLALPIVMVALYYWLRSKQGRDGWHSSCDPHLLKAMQTNSASKGSAWQWLYWPIAVLTVAALAGPAFRELPSPVVRNQAALVIALDLSKSMLADDLKPSRLQRAKFKIKDVLSGREDGQTALIAYAGDAFTVTPLTDDTDTINELLDSLDPDIMPVTGSNAASALNKAGELMQQAGLNKGGVLLITDGVDQNSTSEAASDLEDLGYSTSVLAVATEAGSPIPTRQGFLKDKSGQIVVPKLDVTPLQAVARAGDGSFNLISNSGADIAQWMQQPVDEEETDTLDESKENRQFQDDGPWVIAFIIPMLALLYRRGILMCVLFLPMLPQGVNAFEWQDLWRNPDQQAWQALQNEEAEKAENLAEDQALKATAAYRQGQFDRSAQLFSGDGQNSLESHYNRGNALAHSGNLEAALSSYEQALLIDPQDEDTLYNKQLVEDALKQQQQQQQEQGEDQQQQQDQENQQQNQQGDSSETEQQSQQQDSEQMSESEKQAEREQQQQQAEADQQKTEEEQQAQEQSPAEEGEAGEGEEQVVELTPEEQALDAEEQQAMEQWLRRIKDDPGGLLRRKFLYQYYQKNQNENGNAGSNDEDW
ncbi:VWA domain-containing protein [Marinicella sp. W31]|uniref:VWA domain-containing protein n=1 Tax=Marinicella sp. W31 TaxID=3023713 RepID=UPI003757CF2A